MMQYSDGSLKTRVAPRGLMSDGLNLRRHDIPADHHEHHLVAQSLCGPGDCTPMGRRTPGPRDATTNMEVVQQAKGIHSQHFSR